jgi:hypothetical protein
MSRYKKQVIRVRDMNGIPFLIDAKVREIFAIHENLDRYFPQAKRSSIGNLKFENEKLFTVTHLPTGCMLISSTIGKCQMFVNKIIGFSWNLIPGKDGMIKPPKDFEFDQYKKYAIEFSI